jgi:hypothetical protein
MTARRCWDDILVSPFSVNGTMKSRGKITKADGKHNPGKRKTMSGTLSENKNFKSDGKK